jgi:ribosome-associated translation inhibitor RaiA
MTTEPTITFRGIAASPALEEDILDRVTKLDASCGRIVSCHVTVEVGERRYESASRYRVRIHVVVPHGEVVIAHDGGLQGKTRASRDGDDTRPVEISPELQRAQIAVHQAFDLVKRQLQDFKAKRRSKSAAARKRTTVAPA